MSIIAQHRAVSMVSFILVLHHRTCRWKCGLIMRRPGRIPQEKFTLMYIIIFDDLIYCIISCAGLVDQVVPHHHLASLSSKKREEEGAGCFDAVDIPALLLFSTQQTQPSNGMV